MVIIAVVEEHHSVGKLVNGKQEEFREMVEAIALTYEDRDKFVFGWCSHPEMLSSIALQALDPLPKLLAIRSGDLKYHVLGGATPLPQTVITFLNDLAADKVELLGGNSYYHQIQRAVYDMLTTLG